MTRKSLKKIVNQIYILYYFAFKVVYVADTLGISTESTISLDTYIRREIYDRKNVYVFRSAVAMQFFLQPQIRKTIPPNVGIRGEMADSVHNVTQM